MAKKVDDDFLRDTRKENSKHSPSKSTESEKVFSGSTGETKPAPDPIPGAQSAPGQESVKGEQKNSNDMPPPLQSQAEPEKDDFKEKFGEYFQGMEGMISGAVVTEMVDDLKSSLLAIYAKKNGVDIPKAGFAMDAKSKKLTSFLVDYAIKNKLFDIIKKYPITAAAGVIGISAGSSMLLIHAMKGQKDETTAAKQENERLKKALADFEKKHRAERFEKAETVADQNHTGAGTEDQTAKDVTHEVAPEQNGQVKKSVSEIIRENF